MARDDAVVSRMSLVENVLNDIESEDGLMESLFFPLQPFFFCMTIFLQIFWHLASFSFKAEQTAWHFEALERSCFASENDKILNTKQSKMQPQRKRFFF